MVRNLYDFTHIHIDVYVHKLYQTKTMRASLDELNNKDY